MLCDAASKLGLLRRWSTTRSSRTANVDHGMQHARPKQQAPVMVLPVFIFKVARRSHLRCLVRVCSKHVGQVWRLPATRAALRHSCRRHRHPPSQIPRLAHSCAPRPCDSAWWIPSLELTLPPRRCFTPKLVASLLPLCRCGISMLRSRRRVSGLAPFHVRRSDQRDRVRCSMQYQTHRSGVVLSKTCHSLKPMQCGPSRGRHIHRPLAHHGHFAPREHAAPLL